MTGAGSAASPGARELIASLARTIHEVLDPLVPRGARCALLDFPAYSNVGDSAIWLGERAYLRGRRARIVYTCQLSDYSRWELARGLGDGVILLGGGGNLGDLWPAHQRLRERVIADFPDSRIVQLPQTIHFRDPANLSRARRVFEGHQHLTVLVRDRRSLGIAQAELRAASALCPDMVFALGPLRRRGAPSGDIVWLARSDIESRGGPLPPLSPGEERTDWVTEAPSLTAQMSEVRVRHMGRHPRLLGWLAGPGNLLYDVAARQRLARGCALLARGRVVITDRLHGHTLSLLLGLSHVILDNSYGKVREFFETWTKASPLATWAETPAEALERARALVRELGADR